jgi:alpha-beta hydrolase superfamily lysophospholipase
MHQAPQQGSFLTADGLRLETSFWDPPQHTRAVVVVVHGLGDHRGRYHHLAERLTAHGYATASYDQRGFGRSEGPRAYVASFGLYGEDLGRFLELVRGRHAKVPLFLLGQSMGGLIVADFALQHPGAARGLILCSPAIMTEVAALLQRMSAFAGRVLPRVPTVALDLSQLSRDPEVVRAAREDPHYYGGRIPARTGAEMIAAMHRVQDKAATLSMPLLILHGSADKITAPAGSKLLYERASSTDKTLRIYDGLYHETFNEPEQAQVFEDVIAWLDTHTPGDG